MSEHIHRGEGSTLASTGCPPTGTPEGWSQLANQRLQPCHKDRLGKHLQRLLGLGGNADEEQVFASSDTLSHRLRIRCKGKRQSLYSRQTRPHLDQVTKVSITNKGRWAL